MNAEQQKITMADVQRAINLLPGQILSTNPSMLPEVFTVLYSYHSTRLLSTLFTAVIKYYINGRLYYTEPIYYCNATSSLTTPKTFYQKIC